MNRRNLGLLGGLTALAVGLAVWLSLPDADQNSPLRSGDALFPGLGDRLSEVGKISLSGPEGKTTILLRDGHWVVEERFGYGADRAEIRKLLAGVVRARRLEPKTADSARLDNIDLGEDAVALQISNADGSAVAALKLGRARAPAAGDDRQTFVWAEGDARSWLVSFLPAVTTSPILWLDKQIIGLSNARISGVAISRSDGDNLSLSGQANNIPALQVAGQAANEKLDGGPANETMTALSRLQLADVAPAGDIEGTVIATARYRTFDGLVVTVEILAAESGGSWARLSAEYDPDAALDEDNPSLLTDVPQDGAGEAEALNVKWSGWVYQLLDRDAEALSRPRSAVITAMDAEEN